MKMLGLVVITILLLYCLVGLLLFVFQRSFIYFPSQQVAHPFATEQFRNDAAVIDTIVLNSGRPDAIIYFGGNSEAVVIAKEL